MGEAARKLDWLAEHQWKPGQSGNPAGRPKGARAKIEEIFLKDLYESWQKNGVEALQLSFEKDPISYARIVASILPKAIVEDGEPLDRGKLRAALSVIDSYLAGEVAGDEGGTNTGGPATG